LGNPGEFTIAELAELVLSKTGSSSGISHHPLPTDDPVRRQPDITRAITTLNWRPTTELADGLDRTIGYFRATFSA
jgi:nucleoside-diphosphate-sugar epimerase